MKLFWSRMPLLCFLLILLMRGSLAVAQEPEAQADCCSIANSALQAAANLKKGMPRADVEKEFKTEGGIFLRNDTTYVYRRCPLIKVRIRFELDGDYKDFATGSPNDRVLSVSPVYLQYEIMD